MSSKVKTFKANAAWKTAVHVLFIFCLTATSGQPSRTDKLKSQILDELSKTGGTYAVAFRDLKAGDEVLIQERERFHAASTMKTPVMIEVFKQANAGNFKLSDSITVKNEFKSIVDGSAYQLNATEDSELELYKILGKKRTVYSLMYDMIIASSNLATNIVIEFVDARKVTSTMVEMGAGDLQVLRGVEDSKAFEKGMNNSVTAYGLMVMFEKIARGEAVNKQASEQMIKVLLDQKFNTIIPAQLPKEVRVAHKTGWINKVEHDSGIVILPDGRKYVLVLLSKNLEDKNAAIKTMANVSKLIYEFVK